MVSLSYLFKVSLSSAFLDLQFIECNYFFRDNPDKANQEASHYTTMAGNSLLLYTIRITFFLKTIR